LLWSPIVTIIPLGSHARLGGRIHPIEATHTPVRVGKNAEGPSRPAERKHIMLASTFGDIVWFIIICYFFLAYLVVFFLIIGDLFRDEDTSGLVKGLWVLALLMFPIVSLLAYMILRGGSVAARAKASMNSRQGAGSTGQSPTAELANAKTMLDAGTIDQVEFTMLKSKILA
jgi:hypothetical protein